MVDKNPNVHGMSRDQLFQQSGWSVPWDPSCQVTGVQGGPGLVTFSWLCARSWCTAGRVSHHRYPSPMKLQPLLNVRVWDRAREYPCFRQFGSFMKTLKWISCLSYYIAMVHGWWRLWYLEWKLLVSGFLNCSYSIFPKVNASEGLVLEIHGLIHEFMV